MNIRDLHCSQAIYDANIIVYYCSFVSVPKSNEVIDLCSIETARSHKITKEIVESGKTIITLELILDEIYNKGIAELVDDLCDNPLIKKQFKSNEIPDKVRYIIGEKMKKKLKKLQHKNWFDVVNYIPPSGCINNLEQFYISLDGTPLMMNHFHKKGHYNPVPSYQDLALLCCSANFSLLLVSNDTDITDFIDELKKAKHCFEIFDLEKFQV